MKIKLNTKALIAPLVLLIMHLSLAEYISHTLMLFISVAVLLPVIALYIRLTSEHRNIDVQKYFGEMLVVSSVVLSYIGILSVCINSSEINAKALLLVVLFFTSLSLIGLLFVQQAKRYEIKELITVLENN